MMRGKRGRQPAPDRGLGGIDAVHPSELRVVRSEANARPIQTTMVLELTVQGKHVSPAWMSR